MQVFFPDTEDLPLPPGHRFPAGKYRLLREKLLADGTVRRAELHASPQATLGELERAHDPAYVQSILAGSVSADAQRRIGLPWSQTLVNRSLATTGGSLAAARSALDQGLSGQLAGGTHHAHRDFGSGFCVFNDLAVACLALLAEGRIHRIAILDVDVHQGDGNAAILTGNPGVFVASIHGEKNFPFRKMPSDLDIGLPDGATDDEFLQGLEEALGAISAFQPRLLLYLAGVDPLAEDRLGRLAMTHRGLMSRDRIVFEFCRSHALPVSIAAGGGYADPISLSVEAYANTWHVARDTLKI